MDVRGKSLKAVLYAFLAALFYAVNVPVSKLLLQHIGPASMAALLYLGAGIGIGLLSLFRRKNRTAAEHLTKKDLPYVIGMIALDIAAPVLLVFGISYGSPANASLLGNFEIVATTVIALFVFGEAVSKRLWAAIALIVISSALLENNCTRKISSKSTYEIVILKGIFSGLGSLAIAFACREPVPGTGSAAAALLLGFVSYGLSIFLYVRAQSILGAAKTSAYYAVAPFAGAFLSFVLLDESLTWKYLAALIVMIAGSALVVADTLIRQYSHLHRHTFTHTHDGTTHTHTVTHSHVHNHYLTDDKHGHSHSREELESLPGALHG